MASYDSYVRPDGSIPDINSLVAGLIDLRTEHTYDTVTFALGAGANRYQAFALPVSPTKSLTLTNMREPNKFPSPECLIVDYLGFYIDPTALLSDILLLLANYRFVFYINRKMMWDGLFWMYPPGYGVTGESTKTNEASWMIGPAAPSQTLRFGAYARFIGPNQYFNMDIICDGTAPTFTAAVNLIPFLHGVKGIAVQ